MRIAFEGLLYAVKDSTVDLTDFANQFKIVQNCFSAWQQFCLASKEMQEEKIKMESASFIYKTRMKYRCFVTFCVFTEQSRHLKKRMIFSAWQEVWTAAKQKSLNRELQKKHLLEWSKVAQDRRFEKALLGRILWFLKDLMKKKRKMEASSTEFRRQKLKRKIFKVWNYALVGLPKIKTKVFHLNRSFNIWRKNSIHR